MTHKILLFLVAALAGLALTRAMLPGSPGVARAAHTVASDYDDCGFAWETEPGRSTLRITPAKGNVTLVVPRDLSRSLDGSAAPSSPEGGSLLPIRISGPARLSLPDAELERLGMIRVGAAWIGCYQQFVAEPLVSRALPAFFAIGWQASGRVISDPSAREWAARVGVDLDGLGDEADPGGAKHLLVVGDGSMRARRMARISESPFSNLLVLDPRSQSSDFAHRRCRILAAARQHLQRGMGVAEAGARALAQVDAARFEAADQSELLYAAATLAASNHATAASLTLLSRDPGDESNWFFELAAYALHFSGRAKDPAPIDWHDAFEILWQRMDAALANTAAVRVVDTEAVPKTPAPIAATEAPTGLDMPTVLAHGRQLGVIEDCGCLIKAYGGLARTLELLEERKAGEDSAPYMSVGLGDYFPRPSSPRFHARNIPTVVDLVAALRRHSWINWGPSDLVAAAANEQITSAVADSESVITCNLRFRSQDRQLGTPRVIRANDCQWLLFGLCGTQAPDLGPGDRDAASARFDIEDCRTAALRTIADADRATGCIIACAGVTVAEMCSLANAIDKPCLFLTADDAPVCRTQRLQRLPAVSEIRPRAFVVFHHIGNAGCTSIHAAAVPPRPEPLLLESPVRTQWIIDRIHVKGGTGVGKQVAAAYPEGRWVGVHACGSCHPSQTTQWATTRHGHSMRTLAESERQRFDGCVECHAAAFMAGGYSYGTETLGLDSVGCEVCHGPGSDHAAQPSRRNIQRTPEREVCMSCHTEEHSRMRHGNFNDYLQKVVHSDSGAR